MLPIPLIIGFLLGKDWHPDNIKKYLHRQIAKAIKAEPHREVEFLTQETSWYSYVDLGMTLRGPAASRAIAAEEKIT